MVFYFFAKKPVPSAHGKGRRQRRFFIFLKKFLCREPRATTLGKAGTPELGRFFLELPSVIAKIPRQRPLCRRPLSAKRPHFVFFAFHIDKHIYMTISHATIDNTYISHPHVHTHHMCPQVYTHHKSIETSPQIYKLSQIQRNKFRT
jgi:hypothetical protein